MTLTSSLVGLALKPVESPAWFRARQPQLAHLDSVAIHGHKDDRDTMVETASATLTITRNLVLAIEYFLTTSSRRLKLLPTLLHSHPEWVELKSTISKNLED